MDLLLREWKNEDKTRLKELCNTTDRSYLSDRIPHPYTDADAEWWLNMVAETDGKDGLFRAIVADRQVVGSISIEKKADFRRVDGELGYMMLPTYWGKGIATRAVSLLCETAFDLLSLKRVTATVFEPNKASIRVLEKNAFVLEAKMLNAAVKNGTVYHLLQYVLLK